MKLRIGAIKLSTLDGPVVIPGWHDGTFGVDWRPCNHDLDGSPGGYVVSHLKSGYGVVAVVADIEDVETFVEQLHGAADWNLDTKEEAAAMIGQHGEAIRDVFDTLPHHNPACFCMPAGLHGGGAFGNA